MIYDPFEFIRKDNMQAHALICDDMEKKANGVFTFVIKVNCGEITDYVTHKVITGKNRVSSTTRATGERDAVRTDNGKHSNQRWQAVNGHA